MKTLLPIAAALLLFDANARAAAPPPFAHHVCPNGLEVVVAERHLAPVVTVQIAAHNGAMAEPPNYSGLSHLYEHMFFNGNNVIPNQIAFVARTQELGLLPGGRTMDNRVEYWLTTTTSHYEEAMVIIRDAITSPLLDKAELDRERGVVAAELDRFESSPDFNLLTEVGRAVYWKYPSRKGFANQRPTVRSATPELLRTIQKRYYIPNNSLLVVTGDVRAEDVFKRADKLYAEWAKGPDPFVAFPLVHHPPLPHSRVLTVVQPVQSFEALVSWIGPSSIGPGAREQYAANLLPALSTLPGSKFQSDLVASGACASAGFTFGSGRNSEGKGINGARDQPAIGLWVGASEEKAASCLAAVFAELPKMKSALYFTDGEIQNAARQLDLSSARERETSLDYAQLLSFFWGNLTLADYPTFPEKLHAVTREDLDAYLERYILEKTFVLGALESPALAKSLDVSRLEAIAGVKKAGQK